MSGHRRGRVRHDTGSGGITVGGSVHGRELRGSSARRSVVKDVLKSDTIHASRLKFCNKRSKIGRVRTCISIIKININHSTGRLSAHPGKCDQLLYLRNVSPHPESQACPSGTCAGARASPRSVGTMPVGRHAVAEGRGLKTAPPPSSISRIFRKTFTIEEGNIFFTSSLAVKHPRRLPVESPGESAIDSDSISPRHAAQYNQSKGFRPWTR